MALFDVNQSILYIYFEYSFWGGIKMMASILEDPLGSNTLWAYLGSCCEAYDYFGSFIQMRDRVILKQLL